MFCFAKEDVLAPPPENDDVVNDFDIEEEVIEVENRYSRTLQRQLIYTVAPVIQVIDLAQTLLDTMVSFLRRLIVGSMSYFNCMPCTLLL